MSHHVSFKATRDESRLIGLCVRRWNNLAQQKGAPASSVLELEMDLLATHANGNPLDFDKLLAFADFDFIHDVGGIRRHLDRSTGKLSDFFRPRASKPAPSPKVKAA